MPGHSQVTRKVSDFEPVLEQDPFAKPALEPLNDADREEKRQERVAIHLGLDEPTPRDFDIYTTYAIDTSSTHQNMPGINSRKIIGPELPPPRVLRASEAVRPIIVTKAQRDAHKTWHIPQEISIWDCPLCAQDRRAEEARIEAAKKPSEDPAYLAHERRHRYTLAFTCRFCQKLPEYEEKFKNRIGVLDLMDSSVIRNHQATIVDLNGRDVYVGAFRSREECALARHVAYKLLGSPRANVPPDCSPETFQHSASVTGIVTEKLRQNRLL